MASTTQTSGTPSNAVEGSVQYTSRISYDDQNTFEQKRESIRKANDAAIELEEASKVKPVRNLEGAVKYFSYGGLENMIVLEVKRTAIQMARQAAIDNVAMGRKKILELTQSAEINTSPIVDLIKNNQKKVADYGVAQLKILDDTGTGTVKIPIYNELGEKVTDGLVLSFEAPQSYKYTSNLLFGAMNGTISKTSTIETTTVFFVDTAPKINFSSAKKLILTPVQGRNNTRKELLGGGDVLITISGNIASQMVGNNNFRNRQEYPFTEVEIFRRIVERNDIINISNYLCGNLGITRCVIQDYKLGSQEYANLQPYTITCVAVEPDEANEAVDVISVIDQQIVKSSKEQWYDAILDLKKASRYSGYVTAQLDKLVRKI